MKGQIVEFTHCSLQFSDPDKFRERDIRTLFGFGSHGFTGTEALQADTKEMLLDFGSDAGYWVTTPKGTDAWVAVRKDFAKHRPATENIRILDGKKGRWAPKDIVAMEYPTDRLGVFNQSASHWLIKGRKPGDPNYRANRIMRRKISRYMIRNAMGSAVGIHGTDSNIPDRRFKILPSPILSCWDELDKYPDTHGRITRRGSTIDIVFRLRTDRRVMLKSAYMRGDKQTPMHTDHRPVTVKYLVKEVK